MKLSKLIIAFASIAFLALSATAQPDTEKEELVWYSDLMKANEASEAQNKPIFAFFTGSDWCGWCKRLQANVFAKKAFIDWAKKNVVLLELDFPRYKQLPPELAQQNVNLQQGFKVTGYPTIWIFTMTKDSTGEKHMITPLGKCGYPRGGVPGKEEDKFIADANAILANKK